MVSRYYALLFSDNCNCKEKKKLNSQNMHRITTNVALSKNLIKYSFFLPSRANPPFHISFA